MKRTLTIASILAALVLSAGTTVILAQNGPSQNRNGRGYGGPPANQQERAARQQACPQQSGEVCPQNGPCGQGQGYCWGQGQGQGRGAGKGYRRGLRDGTGPRAQSGTCPLVTPKAAK